MCLCSPVKKMTVGMFLAAMAFVAAALVQLEIDVRPALAAVLTLVLYRGAVCSKTALSLTENVAKLPRRQGRPSEVHQYAEQRS